MQGLSFQQFERRVVASGNGLDPVFASVDPSRDGSRSLPGEWYQAVYLAGKALRRDGGAQLVERPIPAEFLGDDASVAAMTLLGIANASVDRYLRPSFVSYRPDRVSRCGDMERHLVDLVHRLEDPGDDRSESSADLAILAEDGEPVAIHHAHGVVAWTFGLRDMTVDGIQFPAGSLYAARLPFASGRRSPDDEIGVVDATHVDYSFVRMTPWSLPAHMRESEFPKSFAENPDPIMTDASVAEIAHIARSAIRAHDLPIAA